MQGLFSFFSQNLILMEFSVGLVFIMMGLIIALQYLQYRRLSELQIIRYLWLLSLYGLLNGFAKWAQLFIPLQSQYLSPAVVNGLQALQVLLHAIGFACLYLFGAELIIDTFGKFRTLRWSSLFLFLLWVSIMGLAYAGQIYDFQAWVQVGLVWGQFLLSLPGSILVSLALTTQARDFQRGYPRTLVRCIYGAVAAFSLSALTVPIPPLFFSRAPFQPLFWPDDSLAVALTRMVSGLGITYFLTCVMQVFSLENTRRLEEARRVQLLLGERVRISRDLHDGVIQSLYGIGLSLEAAANLIPGTPEEARRQIDHLVRRLDETINNIRYYIMDLTVPELTENNFVNQVGRLVDDFRTGSTIPILYQHSVEEGVQVPPPVRSHLYSILREALSNALKHANAGQIQVSLLIGSEKVDLIVRDDGIGISCPSHAPPFSSGNGYGLANTYQRVASMQGTMNIRNNPDSGVSVHVSIPLAR
ncbi:hypothetical protein SY88_03590 [Clostridiales bacterium PH28_bin88]|nr:hypothetical protein SY88_03590 [Clostridiales bacterium PH28_bin88]